MTSIIEKLNQPVSIKRGGADGPVVGLEIEAGSIGVAEVVVNGSLRVRAAAVEPLPPEAFNDGEVKDPDIVAAGLRSLFSAHKLSRRGVGALVTALHELGDKDVEVTAEDAVIPGLTAVGD